MLKVFEDILRTVGSGDLTNLTLLDLLAAFKMVDHAILLRRLDVGVAIQCGTVAAILDNKHCIGSAGLGLCLSGNLYRMHR